MKDSVLNPAYAFDKATLKLEWIKASLYNQVVPFYVVGKVYYSGMYRGGVIYKIILLDNVTAVTVYMQCDTLSYAIASNSVACNDVIEVFGEIHTKEPVEDLCIQAFEVSLFRGDICTFKHHII